LATKHLAIAAACGLILTLIANPARAGSCASEPPILQHLQVESILDDVAMTHSIDPDLLSAMARAESDECVDAISPKGAVGLMQLMPQTASNYGVQNRFDPVQNALGAARFIDHLRADRLTLPEIVAAYNAGEGAVSRAGGVPHYRETEEYVRRVLWLYLIGHVPQTQVASTDAKPRSAAKARAVVEKPARHFGGSDSDLLAQLAEVRRARRQSLAVDARKQ
jgi:soluble lytic murein transglycosylase-like protein